MSDKGALPVVVDVAIGEGDEIRLSREIAEAVVEIFVVVEVGGEIHVVDPDVVCVLNSDGVAVCLFDF